MKYPLLLMEMRQFKLFMEAENSDKSFPISNSRFDYSRGKGGIQTLEETRKLNKEPVPVIIVSGYSESPAIANPDKYGFNASLKTIYKGRLNRGIN